MELCRESAKGSKMGKAYSEMVHNLISPLIKKDVNFLKVNVLFGKPSEFMDGFIGRHAHIRMLDSFTFSMMFVEVYQSYLC